MKLANKNWQTVGSILLALLILASYEVISDYLKTPRWREVQSKEGKFKIEFPGNPMDTMRILQSEYGETPIHFFMYYGSKVGDSNLSYSVSYFDYPDSVINAIDDKEKLSAFFETQTKKSVNSVHGKLDHETIESIMNYPGRGTKISFKDGLVILRAKDFLVRNRLYSLIVITDVKKDFNKAIDRFFDSFVLL